MRRDVEVYAQRSEPLPGEARWACGSGYLLAARLVLTAAHTVCDGDTPLPMVQVRGQDRQLYAATVVWYRPEVGIDAALLEVTDPHWSAPQWAHPVRYGRFVTRRPGQKCEAIGYPHVVSTPEYRDTHHATGSINPGALLKAGLYAIEVSNPPSAPTAAGSGWAGMCGAGVLCTGLLIGVVTTDPAGFDSRRLVATPITTLFGDPSFAGLIRKHTGTTPILEPVELSALTHRAQPPTSPADLLRADAATAPFRDRPQLSQLLAWCQDPAWFSVRLITGPGGQGKTRLARQLITNLTQPPGVGGDPPGWAGLILADDTSPDQLAVLTDVSTPTLVVVDYAEGRSTTLDPLFAAAARADAKVRLLLLARTAGAWRTDRVAPAAHMTILADNRIVLPLDALDTDPAARADAWQEAVTAFAGRLPDLNGYHHVAWPALVPDLHPPILTSDRFHTVLAVHMDALATLLRAGDPTSAKERPGSGGGDAQEVLLAHEHRYWSRVANEHQVTLNPMTQRCLVAMATLWGAGTCGDARRLVAAALSRPEHDNEVTNTTAWLGTLYQAGERYWSGLQPDPLGEHLVAATLGPTGNCPDLIAHTRDTAANDQLEQGLTVLGRAHQHHPDLHDTLTETARLTGSSGALTAITVATRLPQPRPLLAAVEQFTATTDLQALHDLNDALPRFSLLLGPTTLIIASTLVQRLRQAATSHRDTYLPDLAASVNNLAVRLGEAGRRVEGLAAAQEAVNLRRELVGLNRDAYLPDLAMSVNNLAVQLGEAGRRVEGLTAAQEAVNLRRELADGNPDAYGAARDNALDVATEPTHEEER